MPEFIFDTTALSNFAASDRIELLKAEYQHIAFTTTEVCDELRSGLKAGYGYLENTLTQIKTSDSKGWISILFPLTIHEQNLRSKYDLQLDSGEASCLSLAVSRKFIFVTDDLAARHCASKENVLVTGTIGILVKLVRKRQLSLDEANAMLTKMIRKHYRSPVKRLDKLI